MKEIKANLNFELAKAMVDDNLVHQRVYKIFWRNCRP